MKAHHSFLLMLFCVLFPFSVFAAPVNINNADAAAIDAASAAQRIRRSLGDLRHFVFEVD